jgi:hypothetical protein
MVRRGLWVAVALGAVGVGVIVSGGRVTNTASHAGGATAGLNSATAGTGSGGFGAPEIISHSIVSNAARSASRAATGATKKPKSATSSTPTAQPSGTHTASPTVTVQPTASTPTTTSGADPSGQNPTTTLAGFTNNYIQEFNGNGIPSGWDAYHGAPGGYTVQQANWEPGMCSFSGGEAHFQAVGVNSCGLQYYGTPQIYGAWMARLKADDTPSGVYFSNIFLLFPANNDWPPEIDIYEDLGSRTSTTESMYNTVGSLCGSPPSTQCLGKYGKSNGQSGGVANADDQWHTYGVEWTPSGVTWFIDGRVVFSAPASEVKAGAKQPDTPMYMDLQSQNVGSQAGASSQIGTMDVDWVEEFSWNG